MACASSARSRPASEPASQKRTSSIVRWFKISMAVVSDESRAVKAAPAIVILSGVGPLRPSEPSPYTAAAVSAYRPSTSEVSRASS